VLDRDGGLGPAVLVQLPGPPRVPSPIEWRSHAHQEVELTQDLTSLSDDQAGCVEIDLQEGGITSAPRRSQERPRGAVFSFVRKEDGCSRANLPDEDPTIKQAGRRPRKWPPLVARSGSRPQAVSASQVVS